ncbi:ras-interacting protein 1-like, partial [Scyliorhinus torazame]
MFGRARWSSERKLAEGAGERGSPTALGEGAPAPEADELSVQPGAPGVLKIFGERIRPGANYKSVLATARSSAGGLVKEVLARYGMAELPSSDFLLCEVLGRGDGPAGNWQPQCLRAVGDSERPLVLQEMWRPRWGLARRFEIRRRKEIESSNREESEESVTEGINAQARRLQRSRAGVSTGDSATLRRSISEANLTSQRRRDRKGVKSVLVLDGSGGEQPEDADIASRPQDFDFEDMAQSLVRPPTTVPYFLVLQGHNEKKDLVLHLMTGKRHTFGRGAGRQQGSESVDTALCAPDILPRHCCVRRAEVGDPASPAHVRPLPGARVTRNGGLLVAESELRSGDLLGLGAHYLLMYKEPGPAGQRRPSWLPARPGPPGPVREAFFSCQLCGRALQEEEEAFRAYLASRELLLRFQPEEGEEGALLEEIARGAKEARPEDGQDQPDAGGDEFVLAPAYLFAICLQFAAGSLEPSHMPALLIKVANVVKRKTWEKIKEIDGKQAETQSQEGEQPPTRALADVTSDLRPLMYWMSNSIELLNFAQKKVEELEKDWETAQPEAFSPDPVSCTDFGACEEAMGLLDEVIMYTFQQCVYYLTKVSKMYGSSPIRPHSCVRNLARSFRS